MVLLRGIGVVVSIWIFLALLVAATFIDFDHFIIPDSITLGGLGAGLIASLAFPELQGEEGHLKGLWMSIVGASAGFGLLWAVVNLGKLAFGRIKFEFEEPIIGKSRSPRVGATATETWLEIFGAVSQR